MSPEKQRIAIAEAHKNEAWVSHPAEWHGEGAARWMVPQYWTRNGIRRPMLEVDDYLNDLNACHEFEKTLTDEEKVKYLYVLRDVVRGKSLTHPFGMESAFDCAFATAAQRCEAFLKAKNLWVDQ